MEIEAAPLQVRGQKINEIPETIPSETEIEAATRTASDAREEGEEESLRIKWNTRQRFQIQKCTEWSSLTQSIKQRGIWNP